MPGYEPPSYGPLAGPDYGALAAPDYGWQGTMPEECMGTTLDWGHCLYDNDRHDHAKSETASNAGSGSGKGARR
jgi:hypothetical protein